METGWQKYLVSDVERPAEGKNRSWTKGREMENSLKARVKEANEESEKAGSVQAYEKKKRGLSALS